MRRPTEGGSIQWERGGRLSGLAALLLPPFVFGAGAEGGGGREDPLIWVSVSTFPCIIARKVIQHYSFGVGGGVPKGTRLARP